MTSEHPANAQQHQCAWLGDESSISSSVADANLVADKFALILIQYFTVRKHRNKRRNVWYGQR